MANKEKVILLVSNEPCYDTWRFEKVAQMRFDLRKRFNWLEISESGVFASWKHTGKETWLSDSEIEDYTIPSYFELQQK